MIDYTITMPDIFINQQRNEDKTEQQELSRLPRQTPSETHRHSSSLPPETEAKTPGLFTAYCPHPRGLRFINQEPGEELLLFLRRHFITNVPWILFTFFLLLVPPILILIITVANFAVFTVPAAFQFIFLVFYYLFVAAYVLGKFIVWFYHVGIVTPKRLMDLDVDNVLHYHHAETELRDVVDVSYIQKGFFQSFFNYGNVPIQTEAIRANFEFEQTPHPASVADIVTDLRPQLGKGKIHHES